MMKLKIRGYWNHYIRMSIRQKMIISLIFCVIIPIIILGIIFSVRVYRLSELNQYEMQINQLIRSANDVDTLYENIVREAAVLSGYDSIKAILAGNATVMDYKNAAEWMNNANLKIDFCSTIAVSKNGEVVFQRGPAYMEELENIKHTKPIEDNSTLYSWAAQNPVKFKQGVHTRTKRQVSYYTTIMKALTLQNEGVLSVHIDEDALLNKLLPYEENKMGYNIVLFNANGEVMLSNTMAPEITQTCWDEINKERATKGAGYFSVDTKDGAHIALYTKCGGSNWYLMQTEKKISYFSTQVLFIGTAVLLCILFGCIYGMIQNRTIIKPLHHLAQRIDVVKQGVLEKKEYKMAYDEIGNVESGFEDMVAHIHKLINQVYLQTIKTQEAEREMLLAKMNPHFLYNSLDSIHWLAIRNRDYEVSELLEVLAGIYRKIMASGQSMTTVEEDMCFIDDYIFLLEFQMGDRIEFMKDIPAEVSGFSIPKLITQPLIENAVGHGLDKTKSGGKVKIRVRAMDSSLKIVVIDNGCGCDSDNLNAIVADKDGDTAFALRNIYDRVRLRYGEQFGLKVYSKEGWGTIVKVTIGLEELI